MKHARFWILIGVLAGGSLSGQFCAAQALAATSECQPIPAAQSSATASASGAASSPADLCVSVVPAEPDVQGGQPASFTIQVWTQNGSVPGVTVTLTATPVGLPPAFTGSCPSGDDTAECQLGDMAASAQADMRATMPTISEVSGVTLTATATAAVTPAMATLPQATATVAITTPPPSSTPPSSSTPPASSSAPASSTPPASAGRSPSSQASSRASQSPGTSTAATSPAGTSPAPSSTTSSGQISPVPLESLPTLEVISPVPTGNAGGMFPAISPSGTPASPASIAPGLDRQVRQRPLSDSTTLPGGMPIAAAQVLGLGLLMLAGLLATTKLTVRRRPGKPGPGGTNRPGKN